jgi:hypothetical protein
MTTQVPQVAKQAELEDSAGNRTRKVSRTTNESGDHVSLNNLRPTLTCSTGHYLQQAITILYAYIVITVSIVPKVLSNLRS